MKITYDTENLDFSSEEAPNLLQICIGRKLPISHSCEGMASCGTCRVIITDGLDGLPPRNLLEQEMADDRNFAPEERLACQMDLPNLKATFRFKLPED